VELKESEIGPLPAHWRVVRLGEVANIGHRGQKRLFQVQVPFIPMALIPEDGLYLDKWEKRAPQDVRSGVLVKNGDLLLAKITPCFENGKQGIVRNLPDGWGYATTEVFPIYPKDHQRLLLEFLAYYLKVENVRQALASKMEGTTGRQRLPKAVLIECKIPLPPAPRTAGDRPHAAGRGRSHRGRGEGESRAGGALQDPAAPPDDGQDSPARGIRERI